MILMPDHAQEIHRTIYSPNRFRITAYKGLVTYYGEGGGGASEVLLLRKGGWGSFSHSKGGGGGGTRSFGVVFTC